MGMTFKQRQENDKRREYCVANSLCVDCNAPATKNKDGEMSKRCDAHKRKNHGGKARGRYARPKVVDEFDMEESYGWLDQPSFSKLCDRIEKVVKRLKRPVEAEIRRQFADTPRDRFGAALESLCGQQRIISMPSGEMTRYSAIKPREVRELRYANNNAPAPPSTRTNPYGLFDGSPRVTA